MDENRTGDVLKACKSLFQKWAVGKKLRADSWGRPVVHGLACGVISVSSRLAGTSSESFRPALLTVTGLNSQFSNHLSGRGSWLLIALNVSSTEVHSIPLSGSFKAQAILTSLYVTYTEPECLIQRFVATNFLSLCLWLTRQEPNFQTESRKTAHVVLPFSFPASCFSSPASSQDMWFSEHFHASLCMSAGNTGCPRPTLDFHFQSGSALGDAVLLLVLEVVNLTFPA